MIISELTKTLNEKIAKFGDFEVDHIDFDETGTPSIWVAYNLETVVGPVRQTMPIDQMFNY
jgi:hypothetical protein